MVPFAVKANTTCCHNVTGSVGGRPSAQGALILVDSEVAWSPTRDRMGGVARQNAPVQIPTKCRGQRFRSCPSGQICHCF
jgi:hypothetical protein